MTLSRIGSALLILLSLASFFLVYYLNSPTANVEFFFRKDFLLTIVSVVITLLISASFLSRKIFGETEDVSEEATNKAYYQALDSYFRTKNSSPEILKTFLLKKGVVTTTDATADSSHNKQSSEKQDIEFIEQNSLKQIFDLSITSAKKSRELYSRSGVYLIVGILIAIIGLLLFYLYPVTKPDVGTNDLNTILTVTLLPRFGVLIFIELIAFFFLKQYRPAMDEYRYFEAIQRRREELLVALKLFKENEVKPDIYLLLKENNFFSTAGKLSNNETTELLETKKLEKSDFELLEKLVGIIKNSK